MNYTKVGPFIGNSPPAFDTPPFLNGLETAAYSIRPQITHAVFQQGGNTVALRMSDGTQLSSLATSAANNVTVINAAINDASPSQASGWRGGGLVYIDRGQYAISSSIILKYGVSLIGSGAVGYDNWDSAGLFGTSLQPSAGMTAGTAAIQAGVTATTTRVATNPHGSRISHLLVDCGLNVNNVDGIVWQDCSYTRTEEVYVKDARFGIAYNGVVQQAGGPTTGSSLDNILRNSTIKNCNYGVYAIGPNSTDGEVVNCRIMSCNNASVYLRSGGWQILGGHYTAGGACKHIDAVATQITVTGVYLDSGSTYVAVIQSNLATFTGNLVATSGSQNAVVQLPWGKVAAIGNTFYNLSGSTIKGFFEMPAGTPEGIVSGNMVRNKGTGFVAAVVNGSGAAFPATNTTSMFVGQNTVHTS